MNTIDTERLRALLGCFTVGEAFDLAERHAAQESQLYAFDSEADRADWCERHATAHARLLHRFVKEDK